MRGDEQQKERCLKALRYLQLALCRSSEVSSFGFEVEDEVSPTDTLEGYKLEGWKNLTLKVRWRVT